MSTWYWVVGNYYGALSIAVENLNLKVWWKIWNDSLSMYKVSVTPNLDVTTCQSEPQIFNIYICIPLYTSTLVLNITWLPSASRTASIVVRWGLREKPNPKCVSGSGGSLCLLCNQLLSPTSVIRSYTYNDYGAHCCHLVPWSVSVGRVSDSHALCTLSSLVPLNQITVEKCAAFVGLIVFFTTLNINRVRVKCINICVIYDAEH